MSEPVLTGQDEDAAEGPMPDVLYASVVLSGREVDYAQHIEALVDAKLANVKVSLMEAIAVAQLSEDEGRIRGQSRTIQPSRHVLGAAAVALIEPDDIEAGGEGLVGEAAHVVRFARSFETVQGQQRRRGFTAGLPVAVRQHARIRRDVEIAGFSSGKRVQRPSPGPRIQRHSMAAGPSR
jgi:hypothetical protein